MRGVKTVNLLSGLLAAGMLLSGCAGPPPSPGTSASLQSREPPAETGILMEPQSGLIQTGLIAGQVLDGADGPIHYSYYLPGDYSTSGEYPMMVVMPGYDMMWFGEQSSGSNLNWTGFRAWTELAEDMIVVSVQLTDWGEISARQAVELTEYFLEHFSVDQNRVYAAGYSAGGETMSQAVSLRPDLYAAYLHGASQWDGGYAPLAKERVSVYIFMAENDEYYGSRQARDAYDRLRSAYENAGIPGDEIDRLLQVEIPDNAWFREHGITGSYHGGGNVLFDQKRILNWITSARKSDVSGPQNTAFSDVSADARYAGAVGHARAHGLMNAARARAAVILSSYMEQ